MAGSSQELEPDELAALLARKATEDAVALRYDELLDAVPLAREVAVKLVGEVGGWASDLLDAFSE